MGATHLLFHNQGRGRPIGGGVVTPIPKTIAGLTVWLDGSDISTLYQDSAKTTPVTADGDVVGAMADLSGNGNDVVQATTANKPLYKASIQNSLSVVRFDGVNDYLAATAFTLNQPEHVFLVGNVIAWTSNDYIWDGNTLDLMGLYSQVPDRLALYAGAGGPFIVPTPGTYLLISAVFDGASSDIRLNGGAAVTGNVGANNAGGLTVGANGGHAAGFGNIEVGEMLVYNVELTGADLTTIKNYLNEKWNIY